MADTCTCRDVIEVIDDAAYGNLVAVLLSLLGLSVSDVNGKCKVVRVCIIFSLDCSQYNVSF